jgi:hypothetical protein
MSKLSDCRCGEPLVLNPESRLFECMSCVGNTMPDAWDLADHEYDYWKENHGES